MNMYKSSPFLGLTAEIKIYYYYYYYYYMWDTYQMSKYKNNSLPGQIEYQKRNHYEVWWHGTGSWCILSTYDISQTWLVCRIKYLALLHFERHWGFVEYSCSLRLILIILNILGKNMLEYWLIQEYITLINNIYFTIQL